jgi:flavin-dependent dehydrogenase
MIEEEIIIIGEGPVGSTCAWKLKEFWKTALILDKCKFPRNKLYAGFNNCPVYKTFLKTIFNGLRKS